MAEIPENENAEPRRSGAAMTAPDVKAWFIHEVLPLEAALTSFLQHNWRNRADIADLRQDARSYIPLLKRRPNSRHPKDPNEPTTCSH